MAQLMKYTQAQWDAIEAKRAARREREARSRTKVMDLARKLLAYDPETLLDIVSDTRDGKGRTYRIVDIREDEAGVHLVIKGLHTIVEGK